jgi:hypothetical protein
MAGSRSLVVREMYPLSIECQQVDYGPRLVDIFDEGKRITIEPILDC